MARWSSSGQKGPGRFVVLKGIVVGKLSPKLHFEADLAIFKQLGEHLCA